MVGSWMTDRLCTVDYTLFVLNKWFMGNMGRETVFSHRLGINFYIVNGISAHSASWKFG